MSAYKHSTVSLLALCCAFGTSGAFAQEETEAAAEREVLIVTGSRSTPRTVFESLAPVDVIGEQAIELTASDELPDVLAQLAPSFNVQRLPMADGQIFVRPARLRNLSPDHTLVLINGKRRHRSALLGSNGAQAPDLAQIPTSAIGRIEVLRDGASAQYGSDAIAGVINIILDDEVNANGFAQAGQYYEGDGLQYRLGAQHTLDLEDGFITGTIEYSDQEETSRSRQRPDAIAFQAANPGIQLDNPVQNWGQPTREALRLAVNSELEVDLGTAYIFGSYGTSDAVSDFNWRNPATTSAFNPSAAYPGFDLNTIYPAGFAPRFGQEDQDLSAVAGLRSDQDGAFTWDASLGFGRHEIDYKISETINASLGSDSPTAFKPGTLIQSEFNVNLDMAYRFGADMLASEGTIAFGVERREETFEIEAGDPASYAIGPAAADGLPSGSNGFPGYSPAQEGEFEQESYAAYVDLELPFTERWTAAIAARYEDFSEFGDNLDGKVSTRYEVTPNLALRATASTGFRAPTPGQLFSERTSQGLDTTTLNIFTAGRFSPQGPVAEVISKRDGVQINDLKPETSVNYSLGLAWDANNGLVTTVDLYQITIDDRFGSSPTFNPTAAEQAEFVALGVAGGEGITRVSFFQNDFDTETTGLDIVSSYAFDLDTGRLSLTAAYNYNQTEVTGGSLQGNETSRIRFEELLPQHNGSFSAVYDWGRFQFLGRARYYGSWTDFSFNAEGDIFQDFGAETFFDAAVTYAPNDLWSLRVGAENIFDTYPAEAEFQANRGLIYSRNAPYDTDGGYYYARVDVNF